MACSTHHATNCHVESRRRKDKGPRADAYLHSVQDKKLKGKLRHTERIYADSQKTAAKVNEWLAPADGGYLEAEGGP